MTRNSLLFAERVRGSTQSKRFVGVISPIFIARAAYVLMSAFFMGCSASNDVHLAEKEVAIFHEMYNTESFDILYVHSARHLKDASSEQDFVSLLSDMHHSLGAVKSSSQTSWKIETNTADGTLVTTKYHIVCDKGRADEIFTYQIQHGRAALGHYDIDAKFIAD